MITEGLLKDMGDQCENGDQTNRNQSAPLRIISDDEGKFYTCNSNGYVKIRESFEENEPPITIPSLFQRIVERYPNNRALAYKKHGLWNFITYSEYLQTVRTVARAFLKLGLKKHRPVSIIGSNSPEWAVAHFASIFAGGISCGIYTSNSAEACLYCLQTSGASIVIVEDDTQSRKILDVRSRAPDLKIIIQYSGIPTDSSVLSWNELLTIGNNELDWKLDEVMQSMAANQCCTILYTSGTTSLPKAVMLSHDNVIVSASMTKKYLKLQDTIERSFSYLPFSHIVGQSFDFYLCLLSGSCCYFADKNVLKSQVTLIENLKEIRPTYLFSVPRVWEKVKESIHLIKKDLYEPEPRIGESSEQSLRHIVNLNMKAHVGLDQCHACLVGAAPLATEVKEYLRSFDILIGEVYGMTESGGPHIVSAREDINFESTGKALPGMRIKIDRMDEYGVGEICMYGRNVFMGYLHEPAKTKEVIDEDGWLHSGDLGKVNDKSCVQICRRIKELIITSGGENVAPALIEKIIKSELPVVSHATVVGEGKNFLSLLITLKCQVNKDSGMPLDELSEEVKDWCRSLGCPCETVSSIIREKPQVVYEVIQKGIDRANDQVISRVHQIRKFTILPRDFSIYTGELGPSVNKVLRSVVNTKYKTEIESMY